MPRWPGNSIHVADTIAALTEMKQNVNKANRQFVGKSAEALRDLARAYAPIGNPGNSTAPPGKLAESITWSYSQQIFDWRTAVNFRHEPSIGMPNSGTALALVGPTAIYGRQRELGGDIYPHTSRSKNGKLYLKFRRYEKFITTDHVYQHPQPYLATAYLMGPFKVEQLAIEYMTYATQSPSSLSLTGL